MELEPANDRIIVQRIDTEEKIVGGIILPQQSQRRSNTAKVVAVSEAIYDDFKVGDEVFLADTAGVSIVFEDEVYLVIRVAEVLARVR